MNKLLALAGLVTLVVSSFTACAGPSAGGPDTRALGGPGAEVAAELGYHGPVNRLARPDGN